MMVFAIAASLLLLGFVTIYVLYRVVFCHPLRNRPDVRQIPDSNLYRVYKKEMLHVIEEMEKTACEEVHIFSEDGLRLYGKLYEIKKDAPLVLFFHGYHGMAAWDGYGFFRICKQNGINLLMIDERAHGKSEGNVITFGIKERYDCKLWVEYALKRFGEHTDIFLAGVSMGAASVMMSSALGLPRSVRAIIADCGYTEPAAIIMETVKAMKLPVKPVYRLIRLGARLFGHFDTEEATALESVRKLTIPFLLIQGEKDCVVPLSMGEALYEACSAKKERLLIAGADHANSALTDYKTYEKTVLKFIERNLTSAIQETDRMG